MSDKRDHHNPLRFATPQAWVDAVMADFDIFLLDHAAAEKKASGMAISMVSHYPDREELVRAMAELAIEELVHYKEVIKVIYDRGLQLADDKKDAYVNEFRQCIRKGTDFYFLDRMIIGAIIEARGAERFGLIADALPEGQLKVMYRAIANSEQRHYQQFLDLAKLYFDEGIVESRASEMLDIEAKIVKALPIQAALH